MTVKIVVFWKMSHALPHNECDHAEAEATESCVRSDSIGAPLLIELNIKSWLVTTNEIYATLRNHPRSIIIN